MDKQEFKKLIRECIEEVLVENLNEGRKICSWCKKDLGFVDVDGESHGICPSCKEKVLKDLPKKEEPPVNEMTGTSAVQGFYGKNWVDPDPKRKRMKDLAAKSVGGKVA